MSCSVSVPSPCNSSPSWVSTRLGATRVGAAGARRLGNFVTAIGSLSPLYGLYPRFLVEKWYPARRRPTHRIARARQFGEDGDIRPFQQVVPRPDAALQPFSGQAHAGPQHGTQNHGQGDIQEQSGPCGIDRCERMVQDCDIRMIEPADQTRLAAALQGGVVRRAGVVRIALEHREFVLIVLESQYALALLLHGALQIRRVPTGNLRFLGDRAMGIVDFRRYLAAQRIEFR